MKSLRKLLLLVLKYWGKVFVIVSPSSNIGGHIPLSRVVFVGRTGDTSWSLELRIPPLVFSFVSQGGMVKIPVTGTGKTVRQAYRSLAVVQYMNVYKPFLLFYSRFLYNPYGYSHSHGIVMGIIFPLHAHFYPGPHKCVFHPQTATHCTYLQLCFQKIFPR